MAAQPKDLSHHLSVESASRKQSPLKAVALSKSSRNIKIISLAGGLPNPEYFPIREIDAEIPAINSWKKDSSNSGKLDTVSVPMSSSDSDVLPLSVALQYGQGSGAALLAQFLKEHTRIIHNPPYEGWNIIMTTGNTSCLDIALRMLTNRGDSILVEKYSFPSALQSMRPLGLSCIPIDMDQFGFLPESMDDILTNWDATSYGSPKPHVLYTIPSGQNPTGSTLSVERRKQIYTLAQKHDIIILEDEPYYYLQMDAYEGKPEAADKAFTNEQFVKELIPSFLSMDVDGRVIRMDSLSKVVAPGSRVGWFTAQPLFIERGLRAAETATQSASGISQGILYAMFKHWGQDGYLEWLKHIRYSYTLRRNYLLYAMDTYLPKSVCSYIPPVAGMFIWFEVDKSRYIHADKNESIPEIESKIHAEAVEEGVNLACGNWFVVDPRVNDKIFFRVTFAHAELEEFNVAIERFAGVLKNNFKC